jgi:hypothetical protein
LISLNQPWTRPWRELVKVWVHSRLSAFDGMHSVYDASMSNVKQLKSSAKKEDDTRLSCAIMHYSPIAMNFISQTYRLNRKLSPDARNWINDVFNKSRFTRSPSLIDKEMNSFDSDEKKVAAAQILQFIRYFQFQILTDSAASPKLPDRLQNLAISVDLELLLLQPSRYPPVLFPAEPNSTSSHASDSRQMMFKLPRAYASTAAKLKGMKLDQMVCNNCIQCDSSWLICFCY